MSALFVIPVGLLILVIAVSFVMQRSRRVASPGDDEVAAVLHPERNWSVLWALILLSIVVSSLLRYLGPLIHLSYVIGTAGVAMGLYICSHPAANAVNMLFYERYLFSHTPSDWSILRWFALNLLVLLAGWVVIFNGLLLLVS